MIRCLPFLMLAVSSVGCFGSPQRLPLCDSWDSDRSICGVMNPEDLGLIPGDGAWIIVSEMARIDQRAKPGSPPEKAGRLSALSAVDGSRHRLFPTEWVNPSGRVEGWGDVTCIGPPDASVFQPHGIDVGSGPGGLATLLVVNHGGREAVEFFEIVPGAPPVIEWRGCVPMPVGIMTNDVALLDGGGFVVTNMMPALEGTGVKAVWTLLKISFGGTTGAVLRWLPGGHVHELANSAGSAPNGIEASSDGREIFVAEWGGKAVYRLRLGEDGEFHRKEVSLDRNPDNLTWTREGRLLAAGQRGGPTKSLGCSAIRGGGCDIGYSVYEIDPVTLEASERIEGRGAASVALEVGDEIFIGFFVGDQITRVSPPN